MEVARRLPLDEIVSLGHATDLREEGLGLARSGDNEGGAELVAAARRLYEGANLSAEVLTRRVVSDASRGTSNTEAATPPAPRHHSYERSKPA